MDVKVVAGAEIRRGRYATNRKRQSRVPGLHLRQRLSVDGNDEIRAEPGEFILTGSPSAKKGKYTFSESLDRQLQLFQIIHRNGTLASYSKSLKRSIGQ